MVQRDNVLKYTSLTREQIKSVIEGRGKAPRVPVILKFWVHPEEFGNKEKAVSEIMDKYPEDAQIIGIRIPDVYTAPQDCVEYRWVNYDEPELKTNTGIDEQTVISDWSQLDDIIKDFPDPEYSGMFPVNPPEDGRYRVGHWWFCLFERHWQLRSMTNALMDYYLFPDKVHCLFRKVTDFYLRMIERAKVELNIDAIFTSDDLGTQKNSFFSNEIFDEFFAPYYKEIAEKIHSLDMHFWLHVCGNVENFIPKFIEIGVDVLHPIQKYTMDEGKIAKLFGNKICIWAGFDVQNIIPFGTPKEVQSEVKFMMDLYNRTDGRFMFTAGNGINGDCTINSLEALFEEAFSYGSQLSYR